jgi:hypothetical protein
MGPGRLYFQFAALPFDVVKKFSDGFKWRTLRGNTVAGIVMDRDCRKLHVRWPFVEVTYSEGGSDVVGVVDS